jgi:membrane protein implicated in regulation of membrane protease activity
MSLAGLWLSAAVVLGIAELLVPGVFLIFLAIAAGVVGLATLALPDLPVAAQLGAFGAWSVVTVLIGKRWYSDYPVETSDPMLNDRARRMIGEMVTVSEAIVEGRGRVRVGDGEWPAAGADAPVGTRMRIVGVAGGVVTVEAT